MNLPLVSGIAAALAFGAGYIVGVLRGIRHEREENNHALGRFWRTMRDSDIRPDAIELIALLLRGGHRR